MVYNFADCALDAKLRELRRNGELCEVEPQVLDLLIFLIENRDRVASRDDIFHAVWHGRFVSDSVLGTRINAARNAIGDSGAGQHLIRTLYGKGFRFVGEIRGESIALGAAMPKVVASTAVPIPMQGAPVIGVIPFATVGGDASEQVFAAGLTEEITIALTRVGWFSVRRFELAVGDCGNSSQAQITSPAYLLQGSVRRANDRIRVSAHLVDSLTNHCFWAQRYDHDIGSAFAVQDEIAGNVTATISGQIFAAENKRAKFRSVDSLHAWNCIVRALSLINTRRRRHVGIANTLLKRAIAIDPKCAPAYSLLSFVSTLGVHLGWHSRKLTEPVALRYARKALALDEEESWGHVALGYATLQLGTRPEEAIEILKGALGLNPNLAIAHYFIALASAYIGNAENAFSHADMAERLGPHDLLARGNAGAHDNVRATASFVAGRYREGIEFARKAIIQSPRQTAAYRQLVINSAFAGEVGEAASALGVVKRLAPGVQRWIRESETMWSRRDCCTQYVEAFRMAGLR